MRCVTLSVFVYSILASICFAQPVPLPEGASLRLGGSLLQQPSDIGALALSPDGRLVATGSWNDSKIRLWKLDTGEKINQLPGPEHGTRALAFSPDGKTLVAAGDGGGLDDPCVFAFDIPSCSPKHVLIAERLAERNHMPANQQALAISPDGTRFLTGGADGAVRLWDMRTGKELKHWLSHKQYVDTVAWSPDGQRAAAGGTGGTVVVFEIDSDAEPIKIKAAKLEINALLFTPDGKQLVSGGNGTVRVWDVASGDMTKELESAEIDRDVEALAWAPDGNTLAVGYLDKTIRLWDFASGKESRKLQGRINDMVGQYAMAFTPDGKRLVASGQGNAVAVWELQSGKRLLVNSESHSGQIRAMCFSPDGRTLYTGSSDQTVRGWDLTTGRGRKLLNLSSWIDYLAVSQDGRMFAAVSHLRTARVLDITTKKEILSIEAGRDGDLSIPAFSPRGDLFALGFAPEDDQQGSYSARLWNLKTGKPAGELPGHGNGVGAINFSRDGQTIATFGCDGVFRTWDVKETTEQLKLRTNENFRTRPHIAIAPDNALFAYIPPRKGFMASEASGQGASQRLINPRTIYVILLPQGPQSSHRDIDYRVLAAPTNSKWLTSMAITDDHRILYASDTSNQVYAWDIATGELTGILSIHDVFWTIAISPDGKTLATGMADGSILIWPVESFRKPQ